MSKKLTFNNGTVLEFTDDSTILTCKSVVKKYADIDTMQDLFKNHLAGADFDGTVYTDVIPVSSSAEESENGNVTVTFVNRQKTTAEVQADQILELQQAVAELAGGAE